MPNWLDQLSRKYINDLVARATNRGASAAQVNPGAVASTIEFNDAPYFGEQAEQRITNAMIGAGMGLLAGGPIGAAVGGGAGLASGLHPELDRAMEAMGPGLPLMASVPMYSGRRALMKKLGVRSGAGLRDFVRRNSQPASYLDAAINAKDVVYHATDPEAAAKILEAGEILPNPWLHQGLGSKKVKANMAGMKGKKGPLQHG